MSMHDPGNGEEQTVDPLSVSGGEVRVIPFTPGVTTTLLLPVMLKFNAPLGLMLLIVFTRAGVHESEMTLLHVSPLISTHV